MLNGTEKNLSVLGMPRDFTIETGMPLDLNSAIEYIVVFNSGRLFFTGGFDSVESLRMSIADRDEIHGSYHGGSEDTPWQNTIINGYATETIIDIRSDTATENEG